nr:YciI family protein [Verrucomicrobiota bacterium]
VVDGPFAESKEAIGGYFLLTVADEDEAVAVARQCPLLEHGGVVEVRPVAPECPIGASMRAKAEPAHA